MELATQREKEKTMTALEALKESLEAFGLGGTVGDSTGNEIPLEVALMGTLLAYGFKLEKIGE